MKNTTLNSSFADAVFFNSSLTTLGDSPDEREVLESWDTMFRGKNMAYVNSWLNIVFGRLGSFILLPYLGREQQRIIVRIALENGMRIKAVFAGKNSKKDFTENIFITSPPNTVHASAPESRLLNALYVLFRERSLSDITKWLNCRIGDPHNVYFVCVPHLADEQFKTTLKVLLERGSEIKITLKRPKPTKKPKGRK